MKTYTITYDNGSKDTFMAKSYTERAGTMRFEGVHSPEGLHPFDTLIVNVDKVRSLAVRDDAATQQAPA